MEDSTKTQGVPAPSMPETAKDGGGTGQKNAARAKRRAHKQKAAEAAAAQAVMSSPPAQPAKLQKRHWGTLASFLALVVMPIILTGIYMFSLAKDQYQSKAAFTVRGQEASESSDLLGGLAQFTGASIASDTDILYAFIQSQEMLSQVSEKVDLHAHYSQHWDEDKLFSLWPDASVEDLEWFWSRVVRVSYDAGARLLEIQVLAFDAKTARDITQAILASSQERLNILNNAARRDAMRYAQEDLRDALERLKSAREALTAFRARTRIVDPSSDIQGRMGVLNNLQQQLAVELVEYELLKNSVGEGDPRLVTSGQRIEAIRVQIDLERQIFVSSDVDEGNDGSDYPSLISEFEELSVEREFAEELYRAALSGMEAAKEMATRDVRYLVTYIKPTLAQTPQYPRRVVSVGIVGLFLFLAWSIAILIFYSIRDRS